jgi:diadenosine tetraphosphate (Ap4A) HIT family hydrolase/5-methylcytosine-specific restriction endonuclease McrA
MNYDQLKDFIANQMRMSHIYQPVMLRHLLLRLGKSTDVEIAAQLLLYDEGQIEYYQQITNRMVGKVLQRRGIVIKDGSSYVLPTFNKLSAQQISELVQLCEHKLDTYIKKRGSKIWHHRRVNRIPISGTVRYEVLKRAKFHCELCGISADVKALEVDHIVPKNHGGEDSINNYQALCYSCNASKGDRDKTDFRDVRLQHKHREDDCLFCDIPEKRILAENNLAFVILDRYPVTKDHSLIIPKRHSSHYFELNQAEVNAINSLALELKRVLEIKDTSIRGINIGYNCGEYAGQTIPHTPMHFIPRRVGDVEIPTGGIRNIIPGKGSYLH